MCPMCILFHNFAPCFTFTFRMIVLVTESMVIGPKIEKKIFAFFHVSWLPEPEKPKKENFCDFIVRMSRPKSLNISRSPHARALILVRKHFYIWGIDAIKIFLELIGVFCIYPPFFTFLKFWKISVLLSRLLYITEGKYWNQLEKIRKFRVVLSSRSRETGSTAKNWRHLIQPSQDPTYIYFFWVRGHG